MRHGKGTVRAEAKALSLGCTDSPIDALSMHPEALTHREYIVRRLWPATLSDWRMSHNAACASFLPHGMRAGELFTELLFGGTLTHIRIRMVSSRRSMKELGCAQQ